MPSPSDPISEADRQARAAFAAYLQFYQVDRKTDGQPISLDRRTVGRIVAGKRDVPPGVARELAAKIRQDMVTAYEPAKLEGWAMALELWAQDCAPRQSKGTITFDDDRSIEFRGSDDAPIRSKTGGGYHG